MSSDALRSSSKGKKSTKKKSRSLDKHTQEKTTFLSLNSIMSALKVAPFVAAAAAAAAAYAGKTKKRGGEGFLGCCFCRRDSSFFVFFVFFFSSAAFS